MAKKEDKTNVMRLLDQAGVAYTAHTYPHEDGAVDGVTVARMTGQDPDRVFKTLVTRGASGAYYVFPIPVGAELLSLTGYVHGGCSPVGMKKRFPTIFDETCLLFDTILVSAGKIGYQVEVGPEDLMVLVGGTAADVTVEG